MTSLKSTQRIKESDIQASICDYLEIRRRFFFRVNNIPAFNKNVDGSIRMRRLPKHTPRGLPDIIVIVGGVFYGLEVKKEGGKQSPEQKIIQKDIEAHGGKYFVVKSIDDVKAIGL